MQNEMPRLRPQDLANSKEMKCEKCECNTFNPVVMIRVVSALVSPTGQEVTVPIQSFACTKCHHVNEAFLPKFDMD